MAQRDRLRARCEALSRARSRELQAQVQNVQIVKGGQRKLYEGAIPAKLQQELQSRRWRRCLQSQLEGADHDLDLESAGTAPESISPFDNLAKSERPLRKLKEMSPMERTYSLLPKLYLVSLLLTDWKTITECVSAEHVTHPGRTTTIITSNQGKCERAFSLRCCRPSLVFITTLPLVARLGGMRQYNQQRALVSPTPRWFRSIYKNAWPPKLWKPACLNYCCRGGQQLD
jgi:hypothetical protein